MTLLGFPDPTRRHSQKSDWQDHNMLAHANGNFQPWQSNESNAPLLLVVSPRQIVAKFARIKIWVLTDKVFLSRQLAVVRNLPFAGLRLRA